MKRLFVTLLISVGGLVPLAAAHAAPPQAVAVHVGFGHSRFFYDNLRSHGEWVMLGDGVYAWRPMHMRSGWRPYTLGRWVWTDYGWYWVSSEPFGWIVFHYGRWYYDDYYGWIWLPDDVWGPGWVEWRYENSYIGWAPLPPYASFSVTVGIRFTRTWVAPVNYWTFVRYRYFTSSDVVRYQVGSATARRLIRTTRPAVRYEVEGDRIINRGLDRRTIETRGRIRIGQTDVTISNNRSERFVRDAGRQRIEVYRPSRTDLDRRPEQIDARRSDRRSTLDLNAIERPRTREEIDRGKEATPPRGEQRREQPAPERVTPTPRQEQPRENERAEPRQRETWRVRPEEPKPAEQPRTNPDAGREPTRPQPEAKPAPNNSSQQRRATPPSRQSTPSRPAPQREPERPRPR